MGTGIYTKNDNGRQKPISRFYFAGSTQEKGRIKLDYGFSGDR